MRFFSPVFYFAARARVVLVSGHIHERKQTSAHCATKQHTRCDIRVVLLRNMGLFVFLRAHVRSPYTGATRVFTRGRRSRGVLTLLFTRSIAALPVALVLVSALTALRAARSERRSFTCHAPPQRLYMARDAHACHAPLERPHTARDIHTARFRFFHPTSTIRTVIPPCPSSTSKTRMHSEAPSQLRPITHHQRPRNLTHTSSTISPIPSSNQSHHESARPHSLT